MPEQSVLAYRVEQQEKELDELRQEVKQVRQHVEALERERVKQGAVFVVLISIGAFVTWVLTSLDKIRGMLK